MWLISTIIGPIQCPYLTWNKNKIKHTYGSWALSLSVNCNQVVMAENEKYGRISVFVCNQSWTFFSQETGYSPIFMMPSLAMSIVWSFMFTGCLPVQILFKDSTTFTCTLIFYNISDSVKPWNLTRVFCNIKITCSIDFSLKTPSLSFVVLVLFDLILIHIVLRGICDKASYLGTRQGNIAQ